MGLFKRVGAEVAFGQSLVELSEVQPVHDAAVGQTMLAARRPRITFAHERDELAYSFYFRPLDDTEPDFVHRFVSVKMCHDSEPDYWALSVHEHTFTAENRHSSKRVRYGFVVMGPEVLEAKKTISFVLGSMALDYDPVSQTMVEEYPTVYKQFEKPLLPDDCDTVVGLLKNAASRAIVSRSR